MMMVMLDKKPLYLQVHNLLADRIASGQWGRGQSIPNEYDLAQELSVSIGTLRKAIDLLVSEQMLTRRQGKGTFVLDRTSPTHRNLFDPYRNRDGSFVEWRWTIASHVVGEATLEEARHLKCAPGDAVNRLERVGWNDRRAMRFDVASLPVSRIGDMSGIAPADTFLVVLAYRRGLRLGEAIERLSVGPATDRAAETLGLPQRQLVMRGERVALDATGNPLEWRVSECHFNDEYYEVALGVGRALSPA
jgi:GntR family transcriptional regulator